MARLLTLGAELNSATSGVEVDAVSGAGCSISSTTVRSGNYAYRVASTAGDNHFRHQFSVAGTGGPYFFRLYFRMATLPNVDTNICDLIAGLSRLTGLRVRTTGAIALYNNTTQIGSDGPTLATGKWYRLEIKIDGTGGAGAGIGEAAVDGVVFATSSTQTFTTGTAIATIEWGANVGTGTATTYDFFFDDLALNDSSAGGAQTSYPGPGSVIVLSPNGQGTATGAGAGPNDWKHDDGTAGDSTSWDEVDELPPDDSTSYVKRTTTGVSPTICDMHAFANPSIPVGSKINCVHVGFRGGALSATITNRQLILQLASAGGGALSSSADIGVNINGWATDGAALPHIPQLTSYTDPTTGVAWTVTGTNSLTNAQAGYANSTSSATEIRVSAIWLTVEYVPPSPLYDPKRRRRTILAR